MYIILLPLFVVQAGEMQFTDQQPGLEALVPECQLILQSPRERFCICTLEDKEQSPQVDRMAEATLVLEIHLSKVVEVAARQTLEELLINSRTV